MWPESTKDRITDPDVACGQMHVYCKVHGNPFNIRPGVHSKPEMSASQWCERKSKEIRVTLPFKSIGTVRQKMNIKQKINISFISFKKH